MTQPKPVSAREPAQEDDPPASPAAAQPLPFTARKSAGPQPGARDSAAQAPGAQPPAQPIQFAPARTPNPQAPAAPPAPAAETPIVVKRKRGAGRFIMLIVIPLVALALGFTWWLSSGRYVSTDNAYVGADKSLITPQVTGPIVAVHVVEGQKVKVGDPLFDIDPEPYEIALALAKGKLEAAKIEFANLRTSYLSNIDQIKMGEDAVKRAPGRLRPQERARRRRARAPRPTATPRWPRSMQAKQMLEFVRSQQATVKVKLGGGPDATIDQFPDYMQAKAAVDDAERNLRNAKVLAPIDGVATQVRADRARARRGRRPAGVRDRRRQGPVGRRQSEGIGPDLCPCRPAGDG